ncbi:DUF362 domain-containing protein [Candidatus Omnitrophota bacterium]
MKSDVYIIKTTGSDIRERNSSLLKFLQGMDPFSAYKKDEIVPVKLTIGDARCVYNINPELVKSVVFEIKKKKAKPFLFDTNVIYKGSRLNAVDHLTLAQNKGFAHSKVGAPFVIADGVFGQDGKGYSLDSQYIKKITVPSFVGMTDSLLVLSHITCHILSGYAGALKNVAMGMTSRATKQVQHSSLKPHVIDEKCTSCGCCIDICPVDAISFADRKNNSRASIDQKKCVGCGECLCACKFDAIFINWGEDTHIFSKRMIEAAQFILSKFKNKFFINFAFDITKECDCISTKNEKLICKDIGLLASKDIVSLEQATVDLINRDKDIILEEKKQDAYRTMINYAHEKGLGNLGYNLIDL